jgi:hypothetical protein
MVSKIHAGWRAVVRIRPPESSEEPADRDDRDRTSGNGYLSLDPIPARDGIPAARVR